MRRYVGYFLQGLARLLRIVANFVESLMLAILRPADFMRVTRRCYEANTAPYTRDSYVELGLSSREKEALERWNIVKGEFLVLGCSSGREAIALARRGFTVVGVDFAEPLLEYARESARRRNLKIEFIRQDFSRLSFPAHSFDHALLSGCMYGSLPTKEVRVAFLKDLKVILRPGGKFIFDALFFPRYTGDRLFILKKALAWLTFGNVRYQRGDHLHNHAEFNHYFTHQNELSEEAAIAGFKVDEMIVEEESQMAFVVFSV